MVEEEVDTEVLPAHFERILTADKRKADPQLQKELPDVLQEPGLEIPFLSLLRKCQEIEVVRVLQELLGQVGLWGRKRRLKLVSAFPCRR